MSTTLYLGQKTPGHQAHLSLPTGSSSVGFCYELRYFTAAVKLVRLSLSVTPDTGALGELECLFTKLVRVPGFFVVGL